MAVMSFVNCSLTNNKCDYCLEMKATVKLANLKKKLEKFRSSKEIQQILTAIS